MDRTIRVRSLITDRAEAELSALGRRKEEELEKAGIISSPLFHGICIAPSPEEGRLGYFSASSRLIVIDEAVIEECSQETVRNIFLHELAHALDYNLHGSLSGHSPLFRECCRIVGVAPGFEKSRVRASLAGSRNRKDRIRKLLALSASPFENEAAEAIKKAKMLMARDGLSLRDSREERIYMVPLYRAKRFSFSMRLLLSYISDTTGVYIVTSQDEEGKTAVAYGSLEETEASIYLYDFLISSSEAEIEKERKEGKRISKDSFMRGMLSVLSGRTADKGSDNAIILIRDENRRLAQKIVFSGVRLHKSVARSRGGDAGSYAAGRSFGSRIDVPGGIGRKELGQGR